MMPRREHTIPFPVQEPTGNPDTIREWPPFLRTWGTYVDDGLTDLLYEGTTLLVLLLCIGGLTILSLPAWIGKCARQAVRRLRQV